MFIIDDIMRCDSLNGVDGAHDGVDDDIGDGFDDGVDDGVDGGIENGVGIERRYDLP